LSLGVAGVMGVDAALEDDPKKAAHSRHMAEMKAIHAIPGIGNLLAARDAYNDAGAFGRTLNGSATTPQQTSYDRWDTDTGPKLESFLSALL
jgi:hypothetical protein